MWKSGIMEVVNIGIVLIIINSVVKSFTLWNMNVTDLTGKYDDMDPAWYADIGATISFYMIINVISPHVAFIISYISRLIKRSYDKNCSKKRKTKKLTTHEYLKLHIGPEFSIGTRYAQILSTIFIILFYSSGMPILYLCCFLFFTILYWIDKWMILRYYRTPPHMDLYMSKVFQLIILFSIII